MTNMNVISDEVVKATEVIRKDFVSFRMLKESVNLYSEELFFGRNTVAELNGQFYYMGGEAPSLSSAIFAWQEVHNRLLSSEELKEVLHDNRLPYDR